MTQQYLEYRLVDGYIHNWLTAGPIVLPWEWAPAQAPGRGAAGDADTTAGVLVEGVGDMTGADRQAVIGMFYSAEAALTIPPVDQRSGEVNGQTVYWRYLRCGIDHLVDVSAVYPGWRCTRAWAYARLDLPAATQAELTLTTHGPADVWINQAHVFHRDNFSDGLTSDRFSVSLAEQNVILVRFDQVSDQYCEQDMALRVSGLAPRAAQKAVVRLATRARYPKRQARLEEAFESAYLEEVATYQGAHFNLAWAENPAASLPYNYQVQDAEERVYVEGQANARDKGPVDVGHPFRLYERQYYVTLRAPAKDYVEHNLRYQRRLPIYVLDNAYSGQPYGDYELRVREALEDAACRRGDLFAVIAQMALGRWDQLDVSALLMTTDRANQPDVNQDLGLLGLLLIAYRFFDDPVFPVTLKPPIEAALLNAPYLPPGERLESQVLLGGVNALLAGQRAQAQTFTRTGMTGADLCTLGEKICLDWIQSRAAGGLVDWDSNSELEPVLAALAQLVTFAQSAELAERAAALLDKLLAWLAVQSFRGALAGSQGRTRAGMLKSAQMGGVVGVARLVWGLGVYNLYTAGTVSLACSGYQPPPWFGEIAAQPPAEMLSRTRSQGVGREEVSVVTYQTPDYLLSSAQDYRPGKKGAAQHIWQAALSPEAVVFANHPACVSEDEAHRPGFWLGNAVLPRTAQWKDVLVSIHNLPAGDWMGFTHAYFPCYAFDEYVLHGGWAFGRKGDGYIALTASSRFELVCRGSDAYRELRSPGPHTTWLVQMGRRAVDGEFEDFQAAVLAQPLIWPDLGVAYTTLRGDPLSFGWSGPLKINGVPQPLSAPQHALNPYFTAGWPAHAMEINQGGHHLQLKFD